MKKAPYTYPHRSRAAMVDWLESVGGYSGWNAPSRGSWPFAWNVKISVYGAENAKRLNDASGGEYRLDPALDDAWEEYCEGAPDLFWQICEDMQRPFVEGEYTVYPGTDADKLEWEFAGRSGGWLVLTSAYGHYFRGDDLDDWRDPDEMAFDTLRRIYRAVRCIDADLTRDKIAAEYRYQMAFQRSLWEAERCEETACAQRSGIAA